ncbi:uncharacterized protein LOC125660361 [Ostrea edulis]|uniref:uncharacterized protein LOC125660361 n=1 Tax=Ostrea edulis TaxID=37623 RepID=UPI0024AFFF62|nr:uncharacterized protein LOC125660361 [Ostrea edulis]
MDNTCSTSADYEVGKKLPHIPSKVVNQLGFMMCFRECEAYSFCLSINYNRKLLVCEFNNMKKNASTTLINDRDYMYKEIMNDQNNQCGNVSCKYHSKCLKTVSNSFICIPIDCNEPVPTLLNGHVVQSSPHSITFNCTTGFVAVGNKSTIYCTPEGRWQTLDYGCVLACPDEWKVNSGAEYCFAKQTLQWGSAQVSYLKTLQELLKTSQSDIDNMEK